MSLSARLSLIASALLIAGMITGSSFLIANARQRVNDEIASSATLAYQLLAGLISSTAAPASDVEYRQLLDKVLAVEETRHISIAVEAPGMAAPDSVMTDTPVDTPDWFAERVMPPATEYRIPVGDGSEAIVIRTNAADEVSEVWRETRTFLLVLLAILILLVGILYAIIGRWFRPVATIVRGLENMEEGDYSSKIDVSSVKELNVIAEKLNELGAVLKASREENDRLASKAISIQEEERQRMSRELHDELGQSISAIKAIAYSIVGRTSDLDAKSAEGAKRIGGITEKLRDHIRSMMRRLRPAVLDELGLVPAVQQMVDEWNDTHTDCFCHFESEGELDSVSAPNQMISLYRIIQESLTNVAQHAQASQVEIRLGVCDGDVTLTISDNGCGFDASTVVRGMGLNNIHERVRAMHGSLELETSPGSGVCCRLIVPNLSDKAFE